MLKQVIGDLDDEIVLYTSATVLTAVCLTLGDCMSTQKHSRGCSVTSSSLTMLPSLPTLKEPCSTKFPASHRLSSPSDSCYVLTFWPGQKCHSKVMHRKEVTHSNGSYERKSRGRKLADEMGRAKKKFPWYTTEWCTGREWPLNCMSYFRLMTIKHSISKILWASNDYIIQLSSTSQSSCQESSRQLETRCSWEIHTRPRGPSDTLMEFGVQRRRW